MWIIPTEEKSLLGVLNSQMGWWLITKYCTQIRGGYQLIWKYFGQIPIPQLNGELDDLVDKMIELKNDLQLHSESFLDLLLSKYPMEKPTGKLQNWHELTAEQFLKELNKNLNKGNRRRRKADETELEKPTLKEEQEWLEYFNEQKAEAN